MDVKEYILNKKEDIKTSGLSRDIKTKPSKEFFSFLSALPFDRSLILIVLLLLGFTSAAVFGANRYSLRSRLRHPPAII